MTAQQRADNANGVWLCQTCAKLIDNDPVRFHATLLQGWRAAAEQAALDQVGKASPRQGAMQIVDKWVNSSYPEDAGIIRGLAAAGYDLYWSRANDEAEWVDLQGWEPVLVDQPDGPKARLKVRDHPSVGGYVILLRKKRS